MTDRTLSIATSMQSHWETAHNLYGDAYDAIFEPWRQQIRDCVNDKQIPLMQATLEMSQAAKDAGYPGSIILLSAATIDLIAEGVE